MNIHEVFWSYRLLRGVKPPYANVLAVRPSVLTYFRLSIQLITFEPHKISRRNLLQLIRDPSKMIAIEYGENR